MHTKLWKPQPRNSAHRYSGLTVPELSNTPSLAVPCYLAAGPYWPRLRALFLIRIFLGEDMTRSAMLRVFLIGFLITALFTGCSRDPNVRKQKYLESGNRYRDQGKFREAAIQYSNAIQLDPRFVEAHYQLAETYLK